MIKVNTKPKSMSKKRKNHDKLVEWSCLAPSLGGVLLFFVLPFIVVIYYAMVDNPINPSFAFLNNFINVLNNAAFRQAAKNTAVFSLVSVPLAVVLSLGMALLLDGNIRFKSTFRTFFLCPMMVPVASIVLIWQVLFHFNGAVNEVLLKLGLDKVDWFKSQYNQGIVVLLFLWKNLGYNMILFMAALGNVPKEQLEAAMIDGAGSSARFWKIKLRYISPTVLFVTVFSLINSFKVFREVYLLTGDYPYGQMYLMQHFMNNTFRALDYQKLSAAAIIMALVMVAIIGLLFYAENRFGRDVEE